MSAADGGRGWYPVSPSLAAVGVLAGTRWTVRAWDDCPLGNNVSNEIGLRFVTVPAVWLSMSAVLVLLQVGLRRRPLPGGQVTRRLVLVLVAVALTVLYRVGMGWPLQSHGDCFEGYPLFPFADSGADRGPAPGR
ncbi:hypothetical protein [Streptomyces sp. NPDC086787]|uniref:hypothetical protein n=1 Tax=Streptomyces sp. NPDC086787 TaxID=3365759 RepID=UPI0037FE66E8